MKRADAQKALDDGFSEGVKRLFSGLVTGLIDQDLKAIDHFRNGMAFHDEAYSAASHVIETIFKDEA